MLMAWVSRQNNMKFLLLLLRLYLHQKVLVQQWLVLWKPMGKCWLILKRWRKSRNGDFHGNWPLFCPLNNPAQDEVPDTLQRLSSLAWGDITENVISVAWPDTPPKHLFWMEPLLNLQTSFYIYEVFLNSIFNSVWEKGESTNGGVLPPCLRPVSDPHRSVSTLITISHYHATGSLEDKQPAVDRPNISLCWTLLSPLLGQNWHPNLASPNHSCAWGKSSFSGSTGARVEIASLH